MKNLKIITLLALMSYSTVLYAQKVVPSQKGGLRAPANIKIDGKLTEWGNKLQAYSNHTQFYYTISNDDKYLYLTVQTQHHEIANRILKGGITLTINKSDTKSDPNGIHITYPVIGFFFIRFSEAREVKHGGTSAVARLDTFVNETNAKIASRAKFIKVVGIKGIDSLVSIYNLDGIKAATRLDNQLHFNYELAVSLADLGLDINNPQKFSYQVMINEVAEINLAPKNPKPGEIYADVKLPGQPATDFWGEYTLAR